MEPRRFISLLLSFQSVTCLSQNYVSAASSVTSLYEEQGDQFETATEDSSRDTSYDDPPKTPVPGDYTRSEPRLQTRMTRDDIILEFIRSEEVFLANTQLCVDYFILPIRTENSRSWIGGVPSAVTRFLDWYEDIFNMHAALYQSLESSAAMQESDVVVTGLAIRLNEFVTKLHVYQPYLVSLSDILEEVCFLVSDSTSDFGEFIKLQEDLLKGRGWTLEQLLMEPVNRLTTYQNMFSVSPDAAVAMDSR